MKLPRCGEATAFLAPLTVRRRNWTQGQRYTDARPKPLLHPHFQCHAHLPGSSLLGQSLPVCEVHLPQGGCIWTVVYPSKNVSYSTADFLCKRKSSEIASISKDDDYRRKSSLAILKGKFSNTSVTAWYRRKEGENVHIDNLAIGCLLVIVC